MNPRPLTPRQLQIAACVAADLSNKEIAAHLEMNANTVDSHLTTIREKIGVRSRVGVALWFVTEQQMAGTPPRAIAAALVTARNALADGEILQVARCIHLALSGLDVPEAEVEQVLQRVDRHRCEIPAVNGFPVGIAMLKGMHVQ